MGNETFMPRDINKEHRERLTVLDRTALFITKIVGTTWCAIAFAVLALIGLPDAIQGGTAEIISWITQSLLQLVLLSILMVSQNLQNKHSELRADEDYKTNVEAKKDIELLMKRLDTLEEKKLNKILALLEEK